MTPEERKTYQADWRKKNPTYQRDHRAWLRIEHAKITAEFEAKKPTKRRVKPSGGQRQDWGL